MLAREALRLEASFKAAGERPILCFLHYPPLYQGYRCPELLELIDRYRAERCYYGHLHGPTHRRAFEGRRGETDYALVSADYLGFVPKKSAIKGKMIKKGRYFPKPMVKYRFAMSIICLIRRKKKHECQVC